MIATTGKTFHLTRSKNQTQVISYAPWNTGIPQLLVVQSNTMGDSILTEWIQSMEPVFAYMAKKANTQEDERIQIEEPLIEREQIELSPEQRELEGWLEMSQSAFDFWDNDEDAYYDSL